MALIKYCPQTNPVIGKMNHGNNGNAVNPPAAPMKCPAIKFKTGFPKSMPLNLPLIFFNLHYTADKTVILIML